jgi:uncharacterized protein YndB with AHSA1/START domain/DNA-binding transcriptional ArsR family regulator
VDDVFRALADPSRRRLLDLLHASDGRRLRELQVHLAMTRFGVMAHLRVLEAAGLITTRRSGRDKLHFLNSAVIREIQGDWFRKYSEPLLALPPAATPMGAYGLAQVFVTYVRAAPERVWAALTTPELTRGYYYGNSIRSTFEAGAEYTYVNEDGDTEIAGVIIEAVPPRLLVMTFEARWRDDVAGEPPSKVTFEIDPDGPVCRLTLTHEVAPSSLVRVETAGGWPFILAALKTLLETGEKLGF